MAQVKFNIRVKDNVNGGYFEKGETYEILDEYRVRTIVKNGWGTSIRGNQQEPESKSTDEEASVEQAEEVVNPAPATRGRKPKQAT